MLAELESQTSEMLIQYVKSCSFKLVEVRDEKGFSLLHHAVLKGVPGKV